CARVAPPYRSYWYFDFW
nr:immunoglobulin heavy chain junction region [Macaca mulatta]MOV86743.1 immunoglobulin heavy chain junction region [Macaca mulatta]MOV86913.1 immunoglobulin heavy chain junction region [Macaca mulatta]MOV87034.1 immunoglobulin heavy chain junction region [Macaca mulatta]MOV87044.1 immunoglobulin heavy chain junction region [Macaca mulatta]